MPSTWRCSIGAPAFRLIVSGPHGQPAAVLADNRHNPPAPTPAPSPPTAPPPHCMPAQSPPTASRQRQAAGPPPRGQHTRTLQLSPPGMQLPPAGRHLDQKAPVPQKVVHLTVGIAAGKGPKATPLQHVAAGGQDDAHHGDLLQVFPGVTLAAREVGRHRSGDVSMAQRQIIGRCIGMVGAMGAAPVGGCPCRCRSDLVCQMAAAPTTGPPQP